MKKHKWILPTIAILAEIIGIVLVFTGVGTSAGIGAIGGALATDGSIFNAIKELLK